MCAFVSLRKRCHSQKPRDNDTNVDDVVNTDDDDDDVNETDATAAAALRRLDCCFLFLSSSHCRTHFFVGKGFFKMLLLVQPIVCLSTATSFSLLRMEV